MGVQTLHPVQNHRGRSAAAQWRKSERTKAVAERADRRSIFLGLEEIDNMIIGERIQPDVARGRSESPNQASHEVSKPQMKRQQTVTQRMHNGLSSAGETDGETDVAAQVHQITALPQIVAPQGIYSPQLASRARKYRRICESSGNHLAPDSLPEINGPASSRSSSVSSSRPRAVLSPLQEATSRRSSIASGSSDECASCESGTSERQFQCHQDLFATVLTPRSRSTVNRSKRTRLLPNEDTAATAGLSGSRGSSALSSPAPYSGAGSRRPSNSGLLDESPALSSEESSSKILPPALVSPCTKISPREKQHAFKSLRLLIFRSNKSGTNREKLEAFHAEIGTVKQSVEFFNFWVRVDPNMSGSVEFTDFQAVLNRLESETSVHAIKGVKLTSLLLNRQEGLQGLVMIEDVMQAIWPEITAAQTAQIWQHMRHEYEKLIRKTWVVKEPPLLSVEDRTALEQIFSDLDYAKTGCVSFEALATAQDELDLPLIGRDMLEQYMKKLDTTGSGCITLEQFLLMMCPAGFRALECSNVATLESGAAIVRSYSGTWYARDDENESE